MTAEFRKTEFDMNASQCAEVEEGVVSMRCLGNGLTISRMCGITRSEGIPLYFSNSSCACGDSSVRTEVYHSTSLLRPGLFPGVIVDDAAVEDAMNNSIVTISREI